MASDACELRLKLQSGGVSDDTPSTETAPDPIGDLAERFADGHDCENRRTCKDCRRVASALWMNSAALREQWERGARRTLAEAVVDVCWKATQYGTTEDGDTFAYIVPKGAMHRLIGAAQGAGIAASFRSSNNPTPPGVNNGE